MSSGCSQSLCGLQSPLDHQKGQMLVITVPLVFLSSLVPPVVLAEYDHTLGQFREWNQLKTSETTWKLLFPPPLPPIGLVFCLSSCPNQTSVPLRSSAIPARISRTNHFLRKFCQLEPVNPSFSLWKVHFWKSKQTKGFPDIMLWLEKKEKKNMQASFQGLPKIVDFWRVWAFIPCKYSHLSASGRIFYCFL